MANIAFAMIAFDLSIRAQVERYLLAHTCCPQYAHQLRKRTDALVEFSGGWLAVNELTCDSVNEWLAELATIKKPATVDGYRRAVLAVWNDAYLAGLTDEPPLRVRKIRQRASVVNAYTLEEIRRLLVAAKSLPGRFKNGLPRNTFWEAAIRVGYESGLRRGDALGLEYDAVGPDGRWSIVQSKTGHAHHGRFSQETMELLAKLPRPCGKVLPYPVTIRYFGGGFKAVRKLAGISRGSFKWLRRSAGSYAEQRRTGDGAKILGHRDPRVFDKFYRDRSITDGDSIEPPPL